MNNEVLIKILVKTYDGLLEVWRETKNFELEQRLKRELDRLEALIRQLEQVG